MSAGTQILGAKLMKSRESIPTALSDRESQLLQRFTQGLKVVECGALLGYSTLTIAEIAGSVISIDRHEGYGPSTHRAFMSNVEGIPNIIPIVGEAKDIVPHLRADVYFLDLDGTYQNTLDVLNAIPGRWGWAAVHDFRRVRCEGVEKAILDAKFEVDEVIDTLAIVRRRL